MVELYYNSGKFLQTIDYLVPFYPSPFAFFEQLSQYWLAKNCHYQSQSKLGLCTILYEFACQKEEISTTELQWRIKFDLACHEKPKKLPAWLTVSNEQAYHQAYTNFYRTPENIYKLQMIATCRNKQSGVGYFAQPRFGLSTFFTAFRTVIRPQLYLHSTSVPPTSHRGIAGILHPSSTS